jgi:pyrophosphatase PpaX
VNKAVVFDFDGVVIDSLNVQKKAFYESLELVCGRKDADFNDFLKLSGSSLENILSSMELPLSMIEPYRAISQKCLDEIDVIKGIPEVLQFLYVTEYKIGLCTGKDKKRTIDILKYCNLYEYFDAVVCSDEVEFPKPHPESLARTVELLGSCTEFSILIGDSVNDIECARNANIASIAVDWGVSSYLELEKQNPDYLVKTVDGLLYCILNIFNAKLDYTKKEITM